MLRQQINIKQKICKLIQINAPAKGVFLIQHIILSINFSF